MKLVVAIPSYGRPVKLAATVAGLQREVQPDDIVVFEQPAGKPAGLGCAWNTVCRMATEKHGPEAAYLLLDDDCLFPVLGDVRAVVGHLEEDPALGLVQIQALPGPVEDKLTECRAVLYHAFLARGQVFFASAGGPGVAYPVEDTVSIECHFALDAWLAGWKLARTRRARILREMVTRTPCEDDKKGLAHRATARFDGGIEGSVKDGTPVVCSFKSRFVDTGLATCKWKVRRGAQIPVYPSIRPTMLAQKRHDVALAKRLMVPATWRPK